MKQFFPGKGVEIGMFCQVDCLSKSGLVVGHSSKIGDFSLIRVSGSLSDLGNSIRIGDNVGIGDFAHIGGAGGVFIGDNTITGSYLSIHPENHHFDDSQIPIRLQGVSRKGIRIGCDCWIGAKVTFLDGSVIGDGCVVAAGAVVTGQFGNNLVLAGVPAKVVRARGCA
ncbi:acyltransferase [Neptuniibacter sp. CAU 1671]|uniref:acyltransferase n=1 Tax=Neptuniibacter sp. CAU 1671 TaxID=3032593 RepID=UPI0023D9A77C|nr:acyltransferase [Neptuniibacter sp. CAU 1671]MDF2181411.1 acyltransferase [Neptuniibacter sp. CAU 1671]